MAIRFNTTFKDVIGQTYQIQIDDSKYAGSQVDYIAAGEGFELTYETGGDAGLVSPIFASTCSVFMHIRPDIQSAFNSFVADIVASGDENRFTILIYKNTALYWKGKILTEQLVIPDTYYSQATITASDGLGKLKDIAYGDEGGFELDGTDNIITHLNYIFYKLGLFGFGNPAQQFAIVQNWQYNNEAGRMFEKIQIRHEAFKEIKSDGTILPISCYDVLLQILTRFELRIVQAGGIFYLQQLNYLGDSGNKATDFYSSTGSFTSTAFLSYDTSNIIKLAGGSTWFKQPAKSVTSNYVYKDALNGSNVFNTIAQRNTIYYIEDVPAGNGEVVGFGFDFRVKHVGNPTSLLTFNIQYVFRITDGTLFLTNEGGVFQWVADNSKRVKIINQFELEDFATIEVVQNSGFITAELPTSATLLFSWDYELTDAFGMPVSPLGTTTVTPTRSEGAIIYAVGDANEGTITTIANGSTGTGEAIELQTLVIGDQPFLRSIGRLQYYDSTLLNWINTTDKWGYGANESLTIEQLLTREVIALQQFNVKIKSYVLRSVHTANSKINGEIVTRLSLSANSNITNIESFVVEFDRSAITYTSFTDSEQIGGLPSGATSGGTSSTGHSRLHDVDSSADHAPAGAADYDKYVGTNASTGAIEFVQKIWKRVGTIIKTQTAGDNIQLDNKSGIEHSYSVVKVADNLVSPYINFWRKLSTEVALTASKLLGTITFIGQSNNSGGTLVGARIEARVGVNDFSDTNGGTSLAISTISTNGKDEVQRWKVSDDGTISQVNTAFGVPPLVPKSTVDSTGSFGANARVFNALNTTPTTVINTDHTILCNTTASDAYVQLPAAADAARRILFIKNFRGTNSVIINPNGSEFIVSTSDVYSFTLENAGEFVILQSVQITGGFAWYVQTPDYVNVMQGIKVGSGSNYLEIDSDSFLSLHGLATVWDDVRVPVTATKPGVGVANVPDFATFIGGVKTYLFDASTMEELYFTVQLPHKYKEGSKIYPHIHWAPMQNAGAATVVRWGLEYTWLNNGDTGSTTTTNYTTAIMPSENPVAYKHYISEFSSIGGTGKKISSMLICRVFRDAANAADTLVGDAAMFEIDFHIECDSLGSSEEYVK